MRTLMRYCKLKIVKDCTIIFQRNIRNIGNAIVIKSIKKRSYACPKCSQRLYQLGMSVEGYRRMKKPIITENMEWESSEKGKFSITIEKPIQNNEGEFVGTKKETSVCLTTRKEIEQGLMVVKERVQQETKKMMQLKNKLDSIKEKPKIDDFAKKVKVALTTLAVLDQIKKWEDEYNSLKTQFNEDQVFLAKREEILSKAPVQ